MMIYLAGNGHTPWIEREEFDFYRLESYYFINKREIPHLHKYKSFMFDSGAFTYMGTKKNEKLNWDQYIEDYAKFINDNNIKLFFELDIDVIVGLKEVERLRNKLEQLTKKKCIPVWHKSRGKDYWIKLVKEYDYVAIGGIVMNEIKANEYKYFHWFLQQAKEHNCKVHGLGFTNLKGLKEYKFDSVDSTSWLTGNRFGSIYKFNGETMTKIDSKANQRVKSQETAYNNFKEWVKFSQYAEVKL